MDVEFYQMVFLFIEMFKWFFSFIFVNVLNYSDFQMTDYL